MKISLSLVCKDEEDKIKLWLKNHYKDVDEICILDNGSTDKTKEIIRNFEDPDKKIKLWELNYPHIPYDDSWVEWIPRTVAFWMCSHEWILSIDADEFLEDGWKQKLENIKADAAYSFYHMPFWSDFKTVRLSHNKDPGKWLGSMKGYLIKNDKIKLRWNVQNHHCYPIWDGKELNFIQTGVRLFHYHWAFGLKEHDNRRSDIGGDIKNPNWSLDFRKKYGEQYYDILTEPYNGDHPKVIKEYLEAKK